MRAAFDGLTSLALWWQAVVPPVRRTRPVIQTRSGRGFKAILDSMM
jgi:hypothetical protein